MNKHKQGFTIIEMLIATLIFSLIIIIVTTVVIRFSKQYYHGVIASNTQSTARSIADDITRSIQFNSGSFSPIGSTGYCIGGSKRYSFAPGQQVNGNVHGLVSDTVAACSSGSGLAALNGTLPAGARELLAPNMRLANLKITPHGDLYQLDLKIIYGDDDLLTTDANPANRRCKANTGAEYCSVAEISTIINKRVN